MAYKEREEDLEELYEGEQVGDFGFYGDEADEGDTKVIDGITGEVTNYTYTKLSYPCILFREGFTCEKHKLRVISNMVNTGGTNKDISLYFQQAGEIYKLGMLNGLQVKSFLEIIGVENVFGMYDADTRIEGDKMYVLCTF